MPSERPTRRPRRRALFWTLLFAAVVSVLVLYPYYTTYVAPWRRPVLVVRGEAFDMRYLVKVLRLFGPGQTADSAAPTQALLSIQNGELIRQEAARRKIEIPEEEVTRELERRISQGDEQEFQGRYREFQSRTGLSDGEYRELVKTDLCRQAIVTALGQEIPRTAEQVHVYAIAAESAASADQARRRAEAGEDFSRLAQEYSESPELKANGGDLGWWPKGMQGPVAAAHVKAFGILTKTREEALRARERIDAGQPFREVARELSQDRRSALKGGELGWLGQGAMDPRFDQAAFALEDGQLSQPVATAEGFWLVLVAEKAPAGHLIDDIAFGLAEGAVTPPLLTPEGSYVITVKERDAGRELTPDQRSALQTKALEQFLQETSQRGAAEGWIQWFWDSDRYAWAMEHVGLRGL